MSHLIHSTKGVDVSFVPRPYLIEFAFLHVGISAVDIAVGCCRVRDYAVGAKAECVTFSPSIPIEA